MYSETVCQERMGSDYSVIFSWDDPARRKGNGKVLCQVLEKLVLGYHKRVDQEGVVVEQPVSKKRRGRRQVKAQADPKAAADSSQCQLPLPEIKIGSTKLSAIRNILNFATPESYKSMMHHMSFAGGERSALTENVLAWRHLWTSSPPPDGQVPTEPEEIARRSAVRMQRKLLPDRVTLLGRWNH